MIKRINKKDLILKEVFYVLNGAVFLFVLMEVLKPKIILAYFNLNYLLIVWIFLAIVVVVRNKK